MDTVVLFADRGILKQHPIIAFLDLKPTIDQIETTHHNLWPFALIVIVISMQIETMRSENFVKIIFYNMNMTTDEIAIAENNRTRKIKELVYMEFKWWPDYLSLKWGGIKRYDYENNEEAKKLIQELYDLWISNSAILQKNTDKHKEILCKLVDITDGIIVNDWDWEYYTKSKAKEYIMNY